MSRSDDEPRVVPAYAVTRGRTRSVGRDLPWEALVTTTSAGMAARPRLRFEHARIVDLCRRPTSVAEVSAQVGVPLGVARVLVSDLHADGLLVVHLPTLTDAGRPGTEILERLLTGLRAQT
ncbi:MAG TPA: DUF742 domain-containing protein [Acidimicrobiales bacterium]